MSQRPAIREMFPSLWKEGLGVIDVGCRDGVHGVFKEVVSLVEVAGFEPDPKEAIRLQAAPRRPSPYKSLTYLPYALGGSDGQQPLHLCRSPGASSFYSPNRIFLERFPDPSRFDPIATVVVPVRSLDSLVADPSITLPTHVDFLKVDTQGSELEILQGAAQALERRVLAVEVEVEFARLYAGQPVFRDVDAFLSHRGFTLFKLRRQEWVRRSYAARPHLTAGQLVFGDALYVRDPLSGEGTWAPQTARQAEALVLLAVLYDLYDFALELLASPGISTLVDADRIRNWVARRSGRLGSFIERLRMVRATLSAGERFRRYPSRYARGDGNFYSAIR